MASQLFTVHPPNRATPTEVERIARRRPNAKAVFAVESSNRKHGAARGGFLVACAGVTGKWSGGAES